MPASPGVQRAAARVCGSAVLACSLVVLGAWHAAQPHADRAQSAALPKAGLAQLLETVELIRARINPHLQLSGLLLTMHDGRTRLAQDVASEVREHFGSKVFDAVIPRSVRLAEAPSHGRPISQFDPRSPGADAYYRLALEVVERG